ncbi:MAG TPA: aminotransferase class I/II-fold pyridoxal phosphate-dependent enzyme [Tepidisphaeraceae bacterium]|nr:aminotransferase class I/II-fold pyridoxal phosphate-dependent enzyme [Tepidisphaeraceae bacterium]
MPGTTDNNSTDNSSLTRAIEQALVTRDRDHQLRRRQIVRAIDATHVDIDGRRLTSFCSNNYLGLSHHPRVIEAMARAVREHGAGSAASPLITGHTPAHASAEAALARWKQTEAALLLPSGYQANHAAIQAIAGTAAAAGGRVRFLLDKLAHASLVDAIRAVTGGSVGDRGEGSAGRGFRVFAHNDLAKLSRLLRDAAPDEIQVVVTESIFSMDGDAADLAGLAALKREHPFTLVLDEAHGSGVYGHAGAGYAAEHGLASAVDVFIVTLSKALGAAGGAICASGAFCDAVANFGRAYVYSTATPPALAAAAEAAVGVLRDEPQRQRRVRTLAQHARAELARAGFRFPPGPADSPILPLILGDERAATAAANRLRDAGLLVLPVRPPTVPKGSSRLRVTLSSEHRDDEVERLVAALGRL